MRNLLIIVAFIVGIVAVHAVAGLMAMFPIVSFGLIAWFGWSVWRNIEQ